MRLNRSAIDKQKYKEQPALRSTKLDYELPRSVYAIKDGWQQTCQSGAVVSSLLAALCGQLLVFFKDDRSYSPKTPVPEKVKSFLVAISYISLFLNILAALYSFVMIDNLGEIDYRSSCKRDSFHRDMEQTGRMTASQEGVLMRFGAGRDWKWMIVHWLFTFYSGIVALITSIITYALIEESLATKISLGCIGLFAVIPAIYFVFIRPAILCKIA
ncbi:hypothetical protein CPC08DRAFT_820218 [Agrocybe pediades]|nr:hypothetical protein CPC08DRAFT_820218 [Agrocybe pediades]